VRGHDQSRRRVHGRAWFGIILVATALVVARPVRGQQDPVTEPPAAPARVRESIELAARRVRYWQDGGDQWVLLSGRAAVMQGTEGLRAQEIIVRVKAATSPAGTTYRLDVYAEGLTPVAGQPARDAARETLQADTPPRLYSYVSDGVVRADGPPRGSPTLARSGFLQTGPPARQPGDGAPVAPTDGPRPGPPTAPREDRPVANPASASDAPAGAVNPPDPRPAERSAPRASGREPADPRVRRARDAGATRPAQDDGGLPPPVESAPGGGEGDDTPAPVEPRTAQRGDGELPPPVETPPPGRGDDELPPPAESPPLESAPTVPSLPGGSDPGAPATELAPLPAPGGETTPAPPSDGPRNGPRPSSAEDLKEKERIRDQFTPISPGTQRVTRISPRNSGLTVQRLPLANGLDTVIARGGVNIVTRSAQFGEIDISADSAVIWRRVDPKGRALTTGPNGEEIEDAHSPMEIYLEGNVVLLQDERKVAGNGDQKTYRANQAYYDVLNDRFIGLEAELGMFAPGLIAPVKVNSPRIEQYRPLERAANGTWVYGLQQIRAEETMTTGSRFPKPGYRINSRSIDITRVRTLQTNPNTGKPVGDKSDPEAPDDLTWRIDARQNVFRMGRVPVFYWPRVVMDAEDIEPPLRQFTFRTNNYFGQQALADFNGFRLIGVKRPKNVDLWNVDVDYLSTRTKRFPALGTEIGWFGSDLFNDLADPYDKVKGEAPSVTKDYFGYFDIWGLYDYGRDILGTGPAIETKVPALGKSGYFRGPGGPTPQLSGIPAFTNPRGRVNFRHMQRFLPDDEEHLYEDLRLQIEVGTYSDRYFLEEYYKRLFDIGMDQETLLYGIRQKQNRAFSVWTEANLQSWETETQWLPKLDYFRLGDSLLGDRLTYFQHSGVNYASTHTASEVNNPNIFAFLPYDPISNTSGTLRSGRAYTNHEIDLKLNLGDVVRVVPYLQGQAVGWSNQIAGNEVGRVWGAYGARLDFMAFRAYPTVQSELFNVHGLNHKINFEADYRNAVSNVRLDQIGVQDDLDDNTYETVRRYFALTNYAGGILPMQYDPRHLILRRAISPITGTTDVQATIETIHLGIHQRLQTKRGPEGRRRIIDYMTLDLDTTYFPNASRDNFGKPFGQNMYDWKWFIGDRTSITSYGWFEFFNITGNPIYKTNTNRNNNPFGLNMITTGVSLSRPPRGNIFVGYSIINTGPINTSAPITTVSYWLSPKWYGTSSLMYDFGNRILLSAAGSLTRIGADYLTTVGLTVDPQRQSYMFAFQVSPRLSPNLKLGSSQMAAFDARYAPTQ